MNKQRFATGAISIALAVTMLSTTAVAAATTSFTDVPDKHWAAPSIAEMSDRGVMTGVGNNLYAPSQTLSNAEFLTMLVRQFYKDKIGTGGNKWYSAYVTAADAVGIRKGTSTDAEATISRYDMAQLMYNVMKDKRMAITSLSDTSKVSDWASIPVNYQEAVSACYAMGMLSGVDGNGTFSGTGSMDRAQAAVVMDRLIDSQSTTLPEPTPPASSVPDGALPIGSSNSKLQDGEFQPDGSIKLECDGMVGTGGYIKFTNTGYATLTLTVTTRGVSHAVEVVGVDSVNGDGRLYKRQAADSTEIYTVDISGVKSIAVGISDGRTCDATVTNIYLS